MKHLHRIVTGIAVLAALSSIVVGIGLLIRWLVKETTPAMFTLVAWAIAVLVLAYGAGLVIEDLYKLGQGLTKADDQTADDQITDQ